MTSRQRQSEQIQKHVQVIKAEADKYNAKEKAQAFYCRALNFQAQAEEFMETASYDEAYESFSQACQIFEDARGFAVHKLQKEAAEAVQFQVREAADKAIAVNAQELSPAYFEGAVQSEKQADAAFTDEDFSQAKELYNIAILRYAMAQEEGLEHKKNEVIAARQQADQSKKLAQQAGAKEEQNACQQALLSYRDGVRYFDKKAYQEAITAFESARTGYQQAQLDAENESKYRIMLDAKRKAEDEHRKAEHVGAPQFFNEEFTKALQLLKQAQHWNSLNNHEKATEFYEKAAQNFLQVSVETHSNIAFQNLEYSRQRVLTIQKQVRPFRTYAERTWDEAEKLKSKAENASQAKNYNQAIDIYEEAYNAYERTKIEADRRLVPQHHAIEETIISKSLGPKNQKALSGSSGVKRLLISVLLILLLLIGSYKVFDSATIKKIVPELTPQSELTISKVTPAEEEFSLLAGVSQLFSVEVQDKQKEGLDLTWFLDGKEQAKGEKWIYTPVFNERETASKEIKALISDQEGHRLEKIWRIKVLSPPVDSKTAPINHPPSIVQAEPFEQNLELEKGGSIIFSVQANDSDANDQLTYRWTLDGQKVSTSLAWLYKAKTEGKHTVTLSVADKEGLQDQHSWDITTNAPQKNQAHRLIKTNPSKQKIALNLGSEVNFSVEAPDNGPNDQLTYTWFLDRRKVSTSPAWLYKAQTEGRHKVYLKVEDKRGVLAQRTWFIITDGPPATCINLDETSDLCLPDANAADEEGVPDQQNTTNNVPANESPAKCIPLDETSELCIPDLNGADKRDGQDQQIDKLAANVPVKNHAPRIVTADPSEQKIELRLGTDLNFSAEASDDDPNDQLTYTWFLDRRKVSVGNQWIYRAQTEGRHKVYLRVSDKRGLLAHHTWFITTAAPPAKCVTLDENNELCLPAP